MPWWRFWQAESAEEKLRNQQQKDAIRALENGYIPPIAKKRALEQLNRNQASFASDLSVREFLLTKESGIQPIGQVMGTCNFNVSYFGSYTSANRATGVLQDITKAQSHARKIAIDRMKQEARLMGASGVIGVRITSKPPDLGRPHTEFTAFGTAVKMPGYGEGCEPFTSDLNGQEFWQLVKAGYHPKSVVMGVCSYYIWTDWTASQQMYGTFGLGSFKNQEVTSYTRGFMVARSHALLALTAETKSLDADGAVGMHISHNIELFEYERSDTKYRDIIVNFVALGTAVKKQQVVVTPSPLMCIDLRECQPRKLKQFAGQPG